MLVQGGSKMIKWVITKDCITTKEDIEQGSKCCVGIGNYTGDPKDLPYKFRLYDDDGNLYYEGRSNDRSTEEAFEPLNWAEADSGCTFIQYLQDRWETL